MEHPLFHLLVITILVTTARGIMTNTVTPSCNINQAICELPPLVIETRQTMTLYPPGEVVATRVVEKNGVLYKQSQCNDPDNLIKLTSAELPYVNTADGSYKYLTTMNGEFPGPTFVVFEGQQVVVNVTNKYLHEGTVVHFHGQHQRGTNFMDGVSGLTQCTINPGETFTYSFKADPAGSHWYHSHKGLQRADGHFGAFVVLPKPGSVYSKNEPEYAEDFMMLVNDWYPLPADVMFKSLYHRLAAFLYPDQCMRPNGRAEDGTRTGAYEFFSALVNGKGRQYDSSGKPITLVPHEVYNVQPRRRYKFRLINAASVLAFKVSIDGHPMTLTHTENGPIVHQTTDSVIVSEAERFEFYIHTTQAVGNYWIRVETLEKDNPHFTLAVLRYAGARDTDPTSQPKQCSNNKPCTVVNCPFRHLTNSICINVEELKSAERYQPARVDKEYIMHFSDTEDEFGISRDSINGNLFKDPITPPVILGRTQYETECASFNCIDGQACRCTNQLKLRLGDTVQFTFFSKRSSHPIHMHGHEFAVLKIGYPVYDSDNRMVTMTEDIVCVNGDCNNPRWRDSSWYGGNIPGLNLVNPVIKDTVSIPAGGYVVVRFKADNPGWWFMHCHIDIHLAEGMAIILQTGTPADMTLAPAHFHLCGSIISRPRGFNSNSQKTVTNIVTSKNNRKNSKRNKKRKNRFPF